MLRFSASITYLWPELPFLDRFAAARRAGFDAVEILFPYDAPAPTLRDRLDGNDLTLVSMNAPPPNYTERPRGFAAVPGGDELFRKDFLRSLRVAKALSAQHLHVMAGVAEGDAARAAYVANLRWAADQAMGQSLVIEPQNRADLPGYFLHDFGQALDILAEVDRPGVALQFDAYHAERITGDTLGSWEACAARTAHVQIAAAPDRGAPDTGPLDLGVFLRAVEEAGYRGWVGAEYKPVGKTDDGLGWVPAARRL